MYSLCSDSVFILASNFCVEQMEYNIEYRHNGVHLVRGEQDKVMLRDLRISRTWNMMPCNLVEVTDISEEYSVSIRVKLP